VHAEELGRLGEGVAGMEGLLVGLEQERVLLELVLDPAQRRSQGSVVEPIHHAQGEEVLAALDLRLGERHARQGVAREPRKLDGDDPELRKRAVLEGIGRVLDLGEVLRAEGVAVDDDEAAPL